MPNEKEQKEILVYTLVLHQARKRLHLTLLQYCVADSIYHLSNNPRGEIIGWCYATKETIAGYLNVHPNTIWDAIEDLIKKGVIERSQSDRRYLKTTKKWYDTAILLKLKLRGESSVSMDNPVEFNKESKETMDITKGNYGKQSSVSMDNKYNNKDINKENINIIYTYYQEKICKTSRLTDGAKDKIKTRLKNYTLEELKMAMDNFSADKWWMENNAHRGVAWFFHSDDRIDQFLNLKGNIPPRRKFNYEDVKVS